MPLMAWRFSLTLQLVDSSWLQVSVTQPSARPAVHGMLVYALLTRLWFTTRYNSVSSPDTGPFPHIHNIHSVRSSP